MYERRVRDKIDLPLPLLVLLLSPSRFPPRKPSAALRGAFRFGRARPAPGRRRTPSDPGAPGVPAVLREAFQRFRS